LAWGQRAHCGHSRGGRLLFQDYVDGLGKSHCRGKSIFWALGHRLLDNRVERLDARR
jgi:hypothetical protein